MATHCRLQIVFVNARFPRKARWCRLRDSNPRPSDYKSVNLCLPKSLIPNKRTINHLKYIYLSICANAPWCVSMCRDMVLIRTRETMSAKKITLDTVKDLAPPGKGNSVVWDGGSGTDLPWKKWSRLSERIRLIQTLIEGGKNEPQTQTRTDHQFAA